MVNLDQFQVYCKLAESKYNTTFLCVDTTKKSEPQVESILQDECTDNGTKLILKRIDFQCNDSLDDHGAYRNALMERKVLTLTTYDDHPNVIKYLGTFTENNSLYLMLPYYEGGDLFDFVSKQRKLEETIAIRLFAQVASGLQYLHFLGYAHRDLSLENILLSDNNQNAVISDFGLATDAIKVCNEVVGKPYYIPPEAYDDKKYYDPKQGDMWSLGIILSIMLFGFPLFQQANRKDACFNYILQHGVKKLLLKWRLLHCISSQTLSLLNCLLTVDPSKRGTFIHILQHPLVKKHFNPLQWR